MSKKVWREEPKRSHIVSLSWWVPYFVILNMQWWYISKLEASKWGSKAIFWDHFISLDSTSSTAKWLWPMTIPNNISQRSMNWQRIAYFYYKHIILFLSLLCRSIVFASENHIRFATVSLPRISTGCLASLTYKKKRQILWLELRFLEILLGFFFGGVYVHSLMFESYVLPTIWEDKTKLHLNENT